MNLTVREGLLLSTMAALVICSGCGGGGGGDSAPVGKPALSALITGLDGTLKFRNSAGTVFSVTGNGSDTIVNLGTYAVGTPLNLELVEKPANQVCGRDDTHIVMPGYDQVISVACTQAMTMVNDPDALAPFGLVSLLVDNIAVDNGQVSGRIDDATDVTAVMDNGMLSFFMPAISAGTHVLHFQLDGQDYSLPFTSGATSAGPAYPRNYLTTQLADLKQKLIDQRSSAPDAQKSGFDSYISDIDDAAGLVSDLSDNDALLTARVLQQVLAESATAAKSLPPKGVGGAFGCEEADKALMTVMAQIGKLSATRGTTLATLGAAIGVGLGVQSFVVISGAAVAAVAVGAIVFDTGSHISDAFSDVYTACVVDPTLNIVNAGSSSGSAKDADRAKAAVSADDGCTTVKRNDDGVKPSFDFQNKKARSFTFERVDQLPMGTATLIAQLKQTLLSLPSALLSTPLRDQIAGAKCKTVTPVPPGTLSVVGISNGHIGPSTSRSGSSLSIKFSWDSLDTPRDPVPFQFTVSNGGSGTNLLRQAVRGVLNFKQPIAYDLQVHVTPNRQGDQPQQFTLLADFEDSFDLKTAPKHGAFAFVDKDAGVFSYTPTSGYIGQDSITFDAVNGDGRSEVKTVIFDVEDSGFVKISRTGARLSDEATEWNCVIDKDTGLMWERKTDDGGLRDVDYVYSWYDTNTASNGGFAGYEDDAHQGDDPGANYLCGGTLTYCNSSAYRNAVNSQSLCGYNDWRIPGKDELIAISKKDKGKYFEGDRVLGDWTSLSTPLVGPPGRQTNDAWIVYFNYGGDFIAAKNSNRAMRLVRR